MYIRKCEFACACVCVNMCFACTQVNAISRGAFTSVLKDNRMENRQHILTKGNVRYYVNTKIDKTGGI